MRPRDFERLASTPCDLLIIGSSFHGLAIALEAARRGLQATLIASADFGSDVVAQHAPIVPGGLHLLRRGRVGAARRAVRARRDLARVAPWLLRPLPFLAATYRSIPGNRLAWRGVFKIDDWVGRHRNVGIEPELHLPAARLVSRAATLRLFPGVRQQGLTGGVQWYDYQILESDRFTIALAAAADAAGASLANHVDVGGVVREQNGITAVQVRDVLTGRDAEIRTGLVVNAASRDTARIMKHFGVEWSHPMVRYISLVTSKPASDIALTAPAQDGRVFTLVPWHGRAVVAASQTCALAAAETQGTDANDAAFIAEANHAFPALAVTRGDVTLVRDSRVPGSFDGSGEIGAVIRPEIIDHGPGPAGLITIVGTDAATALPTASRVVKIAGKKLGKVLRRRGPQPALPGAGIADHEALLIETARAFNLDVPQALMRHLIARYAEHSATIVRLMGSDEALRQPLTTDQAHVAAEVIYTIRHEMAARLSDIVVRRLGLGAAGHPGANVLRAVADVAAPELGWQESRVADEIREVERGYSRRGDQETG